MEVSGYSKGVGYQAGHSLAEKRSDHDWNAVFVGGQWWLLDACWGAGTVDMKRKTFVKRSGSSEVSVIHIIQYTHTADYSIYRQIMSSFYILQQTQYILQHARVGFLEENKFIHAFIHPL